MAAGCRRQPPDPPIRADQIDLELQDRVSLPITQLLELFVVLDLAVLRQSLEQRLHLGGLFLGQLLEELEKSFAIINLANHVVRVRFPAPRVFVIPRLPPLALS